MDINKGKQKLELIKGLILIAKISIASGVSWELAKMLAKHPYLAPLTVILPFKKPSSILLCMLFIELSALFWNCCYDFYH